MLFLAALQTNALFQRFPEKKKLFLQTLKTQQHLFYLLTAI